MNDASPILTNNPPADTSEDELTSLRAVLADEAKPLRERAAQLIEAVKNSRIDSPDTAAEVTSLGGMLTAIADKAELARKVRAQPFDDGKRAVQDAYARAIIDPVKEALETIRKMMGAWRRHLADLAATEQRQRDEDARKAQQEVEAAAKAKEEAEAKGDIGAAIKAEMAEVKAKDRAAMLADEGPTIRPDATIRTQAGAAGVATQRVPVIENIGQCLGWLVLNQGPALREAVMPLIARLTRAKVDIPGVKVVDEQVTRFRRS